MIFIFDLDDTLYKKSNKIIYNPELNKLMKRLKQKGSLFIFTNNSLKNTNNILKQMKLKTMFNKIYFNGIKPNHVMYTIINNDISKRNKKVVFFDDKKENLITAKYYNWTPVHITYNFNIHTAIKRYL